MDKALDAKFNLKLAAVLSIAVLALSLCACTNTRKNQVESKRAQQIVFGAPWEPISFHPQRGIDSASYYAQSLVYEGLIGYDKQLRIVPALAESFSMSPDGKRLEFVLRRNLRFSNGEPLGLNDVLATIKVAQRQGSPFRLDFADIEKLETKDNQLTMHMSKPCAPILSRLVELRILPESKLKLPNYGISALGHRPIGAGPFCLSHWQPGLELVFKRNPYYWGEAPKYSELVWRVVPNSYLTALALTKGELDIAQVDARSWQEFLAKAKNLRLAAFPGSRTVYLAFNLARSPFNQLPIRQAIAMSINKQALIHYLYEGFATTATSDFPRGSWAFNPKAKNWPYDPKLAKEMIKSKVAFSILTVKDYQDQASVAADNLREVGIKTEVQIAEYATLRQRYLKKGQFQTCLFSRSVGPDPECILNWGSNGSFNFCRFNNKKVDELLDKGRRAIVPLERKQYYDQIQEILADEQPFVFLLQPQLLVAHTDGVESVELPTKLSLPWDNPVFGARWWQKADK